MKKDFMKAMFLMKDYEERFYESDVSDAVRRVCVHVYSM